MSTVRRTPVACGIDVGTTNTKAVAIDEEGVVVARASRPTPRDAQGLFIDAGVLLESIEDLVARVCGDAYQLHAVSAAGMGEDGVLVDAEMRPLTAALPWFDPRRRGIFRDLRPDLHDDASFDVDSDAARTLVGWRWTRDQVAPGAHRWLALADLSIASWSGRPFMSDTIASRTAAWRSIDREWDSGRVELALGDPELLPEVRRAGDVLGPLARQASWARDAISPDAITVVGGHDHPIGAWGVRQLVPGAVLDSMGTAEVVVASRAVAATARRVEDVDHAPAIGAEGVVRLRVEELARNVEWAAQDPMVAAHIRGLLAGSERPDDLLDSSYFTPGRRGGGRPSYSQDAPASPRARASAVLGALAHAGKSAVEAVAGEFEPTDIRLAGGWIRSPGWIEIKAAVTGQRVAAILEPEVTAVGAAILAAHARGWRPDPTVALAGLSALSSR
ncbi:FGGY-family carbohydrate kinase [Agromyces mangrovi Wang et al. 2018]|uniref:FGGY-family carbohydrate kinase n=1 Tax=Agromyces mangrovi TaxID=1858653 RepID=UPI00257320CF|nr:FGGY family carbohydrate kinase [Agromyces mangrovi]